MSVKCEDGVYNIHGWHIFENQILADFLVSPQHGLVSASIETLSKVKQPIPLFTTEDGIEIFEGDRVWFVNDAMHVDQYDFIKMGGENDLKYYPNWYKYFSTKEKAEDWILMNRPCLSVNDLLVLNDRMGTDVFGKELLRNNLIELVKGKM